MGQAFDEAPNVEEDDGGDLGRAVPVFLPLCPPVLPLYRTAGDADQPFMWTCGRNKRANQKLIRDEVWADPYNAWMATYNDVSNWRRSLVLDRLAQQA